MQEYYQTFYQGEITAKPSENVLYLRPEQIVLPQSAKKARKNHNATIRLAASIRQYGLLEPLSVRIKGEEKGQSVYELVDGKRRFDAALLVGIGKIPCKILPQDDKSYALFGIFESLRGKNLHIFEQAAGYRLLMEDFSLTQEEIAERLGISQSAVANKLRLLQFTREEQQDILEARLTERHARAILRLKTPELRQIAIYRARSEHLNVATTEALVEKILRAEPPKETSKAPKHTSFEEYNPSHGQERPSEVIMHRQIAVGNTAPSKFVLPDLTPLYNSIDRTLAIFRKTGAAASCSHEENENGVRIIIEIPQNA